MKGETLGAIDIGSNAIRLLISNVDSNGGAADFKKAAFIRVPIRLGEDVFTMGRISEAKQELLSDAMTGFFYIMKVTRHWQQVQCVMLKMEKWLLILFENSVVLKLTS
mgnify:CR=1 FL=1